MKTDDDRLELALAGESDALEEVARRGEEEVGT